ncbi:hypothetical protein GCM10009623_19860 [Nocardioides aestuarii]|uniref:Uncharacterized protein n=1 Tax=Nocardioides aestuarii TaxID=252231 RepID=A0ABW4TNS7_9ACTN
MNRRAWGWVAHLTDGGTTPWADWSGEAEPCAEVVPGAQQLELLRRLNLAGGVGAELATTVVASDPPRRSRPSLPLVGGGDVPDHGPRPVDPADVPDGELARLASVLLAQRLASTTLEPAPEVLRPRVWRTRYHLRGDPEVVVPLRRHLVADGRPPGGRHPRVVIVGTDTGQLLVDLWTAQSLRHGAPPWHEWLAATVRQGRLPEQVDLPRLARRELDAGVDRRAVHVVTDPALAAGLLGVRRLPDRPVLSAAAADLGRRVASALRPMARPPRRARLTTEVLRPWLETDDGPALVVPPRHREWVTGRAEHMVGELTRGRYRVHGDPALVRPTERPADNPGVGAAASSRTLALAVRLLLGTPRDES